MKEKLKELKDSKMYLVRCRKVVELCGKFKKKNKVLPEEVKDLLGRVKSDAEKELEICRKLLEEIKSLGGDKKKIEDEEGFLNTIRKEMGVK